MRRGNHRRSGGSLDPARSGRQAQRAPVRLAALLALAACLFLAGGQSSAGHQVSHYPSYYPDEIRIDVVDPAAAGAGLADGTLHAYVGGAPSFAGPVPKHAVPVKSLGSFLVLSASVPFATSQARCDAAHAAMAGLRTGSTAGFVFHPYPVTPYHADYLHHLDRIEVAMRDAGGAARGAASAVGAKGGLAAAIVRAARGTEQSGGDFVLEAVAVEDLLASGGTSLNGWSGPPWIREGWAQAYLLLSPGLAGPAHEAAGRIYETLVRGEARSFAEHADLERRLVAALTGDCTRLVAGYGLREEFFNDTYPEGAENVGNDALSGLNAPLFIRTAKLKDYPWNGKLHVGVPARAAAAWNPIAGFTDAAGALLWAALGDPAMLPIPSNASWMPNRVQAEVTRVVGRSGGLKVPPDAVAPQAGSGALHRVGARAVASAKVVYDVIASPFEDGSKMTPADVLYPFVFAGRWGAGSLGASYEPRLAAALRPALERLVALKLLRVDKTVHAVAEGLDIVTETPVLEVYLKHTPGDDRQVAALVPPWSTVPWHLLVLMEEAAIRGYAAFSQDEAARRGVPWLDLVRDPALNARLLGLAAEFERDAYVPEALGEFVSGDEARARWRALRTFAEKTGHLLVTNGPYRLKAWSSQSVVLEAVRDLTYPLGFGTFDRFVHPPKAIVGEASESKGVITVRAEAEMVLKAGRSYRQVREPLLHTTTRGADGLLVVSRYLLLAPDGKVLAVDKLHWEDDGRFTVALPDKLPPGEYTVILGVFLDGNAVQPSARTVRVKVAATDASR